MVIVSFTLQSRILPLENPYKQSCSNRQHHITQMIVWQVTNRKDFIHLLKSVALHCSFQDILTALSINSLYRPNILFCIWNRDSIYCVKRQHKSMQQSTISHKLCLPVSFSQPLYASLTDQWRLLTPLYRRRTRSTQTTYHTQPLHCNTNNSSKKRLLKRMNPGHYHHSCS